MVVDESSGPRDGDAGSQGRKRAGDEGDGERTVQRGRGRQSRAPSVAVEVVVEIGERRG